jgi:hypothetical protein
MVVSAVPLGHSVGVLVGHCVGTVEHCVVVVPAPVHSVTKSGQVVVLTGHSVALVGQVVMVTGHCVG